MAQLDASIILGGRPAQIESPVNALAKVLQVQGMQQQGQMRDLQMQDAMEARTSKNKLAELYRSAVGADGKIDRNRLFQGAAQQGMGAQIPALQKQFAEADEQTGKVDAAAFKLANDRYGAMKQTMGALYQRQDLTKDLVLQAGQELVQAGILKPEMYEKAIATMPDDPMQLRARLRDGLASQMKPEDILTAFAPKPEKIDNGQTIGFRDVNPNSPTYGKNTGGATVQKQMTPGEISRDATQRRGQNMTDARSREANKAAALSQPFTVAGPDGKDVLVQQNKATGELVPVQGFSPKNSDKAPTEFQGKSAGYGARAEEADAIIRELEGKYSPAAVNAKGALGNVWGVGGALEAGANVALPAEAQRAEQAQRNFVNAVLRQESGAAIAESEFNNAKKQYFPQPGDSAEVIRQKADNRQTAIRGFKANAGKAGGGGASSSWSPPAGGVVDFGSLK